MNTEQSVSESICFFIISCKKNEALYKRFIDVKHQYIILGSPHMNEKYRLEGNILYVKASDTYCGLPEKIIMALEAFISLNHFKAYSYLFKFDDDVQIYKQINDELYNFIKNNPYCGYHLINKFEGSRDWHLKYQHSNSEYWKDKKYDGFYVPWHNGDHGYALSKTLINKINKIWHSSNLELLRITEIFEDLMIAKVCYLLGVPPALIPEQLAIAKKCLNCFSKQT